jgi:hypothetical protein
MQNSVTQKLKKYMEILTEILTCRKEWSSVSRPKYMEALRSASQILPYRKTWSFVNCPNICGYVLYFQISKPSLKLQRTFEIYIYEYIHYIFKVEWPPLRSSGQSSWLQIQRSGFDSRRRYQIFWEVVGLERGSLSLVNTTEELLERKSSGSGL